MHSALNAVRPRLGSSSDARPRRAARLSVAVLLAASLGVLAPCAHAQAPDPDLNDDGTVDVFDLSIVGSCFGQAPSGPCAVADTDGDGDVDMDDLDYVMGAYGQSGFPVGGQNQRPVAEAGPDASAARGATVTLSGAASTDPDGDLLTYRWAFQVVPPGSGATLSDPTSISPSFVLDEHGIYVAYLTVNDGTVDSDVDAVTITTDNSAPSADAGPDQSVALGATVTLDGTGSSDPDGDLLEYRWSIVSAPDGSNATLSDPTSPAPTFSLDRLGTYVVELVVSDGFSDSPPDTVTVSTDNTPPVANAGPDQSVLIGSLVELDGSGSTDVNGDLLTYAWSFLSVPAGSGATLTAPTAVKPQFAVDAPGDYVVQLVVNDGSVDSAPDTVVVSTDNAPPIAVAGPDVTALVGETVDFDGSGSSDANLDPLTYAWAITSRPAGSTSELSDPASVTPSLVIDRAGTYVVRLVVNDGIVDSAPDTLTVTTQNSRPSAQAGADQNRRVGEIVGLDGTGSSDPDLDPLGYAWSIAASPAGSTAALVDADTATPTLVPDLVGTYVVQLVVDDGTIDSAPDTLTIEAAAPAVTVVASPTRGGVPLEVSFSAQIVGGFAPFTYAWDLDGDSVADDTRAAFVELYQSGGLFPVTLTVTDSAGYVLTDDDAIEVLVAPQVVASATPQEGTAPLDVAFSAVASDPDGTIVSYEWDFNGDGVVDQVNATTGDGAFRYQVAGRYFAKLVVTDNDGITASDTVIVSVGIAPVLSASVTPLTGNAPLDVAFTASATDPDGTVVLYEWDFDGDGVIDYSNPASGDTTHTYDVGGIYTAIVNVYDDTGLLATRTFVVSVAGPPVAEPRAYPVRGEAPLTVTFFSDGTDIDGSPEYYDWDFDGNGARDIRLIASMNTTYTYTTPGTYLAELTVEDDDGLTGSATVTIEVLPGSGGADTAPDASARARPSNGGAPLRTSLAGEGSDPNGTIVQYAWDFEGDGTFDFFDVPPSSNSVGRSLDAGSYAAPLLYDMDGDGDRDLAVGNSSGQIVVFENLTGDALPSWGPGTVLTNGAGNVIDIGSYAAPILEDADGDGDQDFLAGNSSGQIYLLENTGGTGSPAWEDRGRITDDGGVIVDVGSYAKPLLLDHDGDGDRDLLVGNSTGVITVYLRSGTPAAPLWTRLGLLQNDTPADIDVGSYAMPMVLPRPAPEADQLLVGNSSGQIRRFSNVGTVLGSDGSTTIPIWRDEGLLQTPAGGTIDVGSYAHPLVFDLYTDGEVRLLVGDSGGLLDIVTEVTGGWELTGSGYNTFDVGSYASPATGDIDGDGDRDLLIGNSVGQMYLRSNLGDAATAVWFRGALLVDDTGTTIDIGSYAAPTLADFDDDGDLDIIAGQSNGWLYFIRNDGDALAPIWVVVGQILDATGTRIDVGSYAAPVAADFDDDGDLDLVVGNSSGRIRHMRNDGSPSAPSWVRVGEIALGDGGALDVGSYAYPAVHDPDRNGTLDLLIGNSNGVMQRYENRDGLGFDLVERLEGPFAGIDVGSYAAPVFEDLDDDGDRDALVGNSAGLVALYPLLGQVTVDYPAQGTYNAVFRVTDNDGETASVTVPIAVLAAGSPSAFASADVTKGGAPLAVTFNGRGTDPDGTVVEFAWDFDGDGTFDSVSATGGAVSHTYDVAGTYDAVLRVTDNAGLTSTDQVKIEVGLLVEPTIGTVQFNPSAGELGTIETRIAGAEVTVTVRIVDGVGTVVRTLVNGAVRTPGTYQDPWDGTDQNGQPVPDGPYYVILEYTVGGETTVVDLRDQTVFEELTPSRNFSSSFNPYTGNPVLVSYQIPWPAEVSLYFWTRDNTRPGSTIAPVRTLFLREARPPGSYTDVWDGFDDNGVVVEPGRQYPVTLWLYRLPDNAIIITGNQPAITTIGVTPIYLAPSFNPYASGPPPSAVVSLETTKDATLQAEIVNQAGLVVRRLTRANRPAGSNTLAWDGRDGEGRLVAPGTYSIGVTAIDALGNRSLSRYAAVTVRY